MPSRLDTLVGRVADPQLRDELHTAVDDLRRITDFGLVFEKHLPETVRLPHHSIRRGIKVTRRDMTDHSMFEVIAVNKSTATIRRLRHADGSAVSRDEARDTPKETAPIADLVALAEFGDPIYPGLRRIDGIQRGGDKPSHVVINGENYHTVQTLQFTHAAKVDCIYIDPPYNTTDKDWKYNNDYVDRDDAYRHSKWLAFMHRRLEQAKTLLNPDNSVLIVTIDENELHRLALMLEQVFPGAGMQLVTSVINRAGSPRPDRLTRVEEYLIFVFIGASAAFAGKSNLLTDEARLDDEPEMPTVWFSACRVGTRKALRSYYTETELFYPVLIDSVTGALHSVGPPLPMGQHPADYTPPKGTTPIWPLSQGREQTWRFSREKMEAAFKAGTARLGRRDPATGDRSVTYLRPGTLKAIDDGIFRVAGHTPEGALELELAEADGRGRPPATVWNVTSHYARDYGSKLLTALVPGQEFPFPKSLYAVEDALRVAVGGKPNAVVLDFFGGSGTTTHAVARLNRQDGGRRSSILVTNNEVSADEARALRKNGLHAGDSEWEALGIFEHVTRPRITAAVTGVRSDGQPIAGDYKFTDEFPMAEGFAENVDFFELTYLDAATVELNMAFEGIAPLLWLRAGAAGPIIRECIDGAGRRKPYSWTDRYGVLFNTDRWRSFVSKLPATATTAYIVTDSTTVFAHIAGELPGHLDVIRLYERYLTTFAINER